MKRYIAILVTTLSILSANGQEVTRVRVGDNQNYGITYNLPAISIHIEAEAVCKTVKAGIFAQYAEKYLGLTDVPMEDAVTWSLVNVSMSSKAVTDTSRTYHITFNEKLPLPTIELKGNCLQAIESADYPHVKAESPRVNDQIVTEEEVPAAVELHAFNVMNEELLKAGSKAKQAEIAARQIFRIRESRLNLLTGDVDNLPADGASFQLVLDNLKAQEVAYMELFTGVTTTTAAKQEYDYRPVGEGNAVLFRFSRHYGFVDADDLSGEPCKLTVTITDDKRSVPVLLDAKGKPKPVATGVAYTVPGKAMVALTFKGKPLTQEEYKMGQFGHVEFLSSTMFANKKAPVSARFCPQTGALLQLKGL